MTSVEADIWENVHNAREAAMQNNYEASLVFYNGAIEQVKRYAFGMDDLVLRGKWHEVSGCGFISVFRWIMESHAKWKMVFVDIQGFYHSFAFHNASLKRVKLAAEVAMKINKFHLLRFSSSSVLSLHSEICWQSLIWEELRCGLMSNGIRHSSFTDERILEKVTRRFVGAHQNIGLRFLAKNVYELFCGAHFRSVAFMN